MAKEEHNSFRDQLLAYHMGWLSRQEMALVEEFLEANPEWVAVSKELADGLEPLSSWNTLPTVDNLEDHILRRVEQQRIGQQNSSMVNPTVRLDPVLDQKAIGPRLPMSIRELAAAAACIVVLLGVVVPSLAKASARARRSVCMDHLRLIGDAQADYNQAFDSYMPYAGIAADAAALEADGIFPSSWLRERTAGVQRLRNSRNRFLLLKEGFLADAYTFVCPSDSDAVVMRFDAIDGFDDFPERSNCSYDSQIMAHSRNRPDSHPQLVVYADSNPLFDIRGSAKTAVAEANSSLHARLGGQNVLRLDGAVSWALSPNVGVQNDNIWRIGQRSNYTGSETPRLATDSFMIP